MKAKVKRTPIQILIRKIKRYLKSEKFDDLLCNLLQSFILIIGMIMYSVASFLIISFLLLLRYYPLF